jgi:hypothetical protein
MRIYIWGYANKKEYHWSAQQTPVVATLLLQMVLFCIANKLYVPINTVLEVNFRNCFARVG